MKNFITCKNVLKDFLFKIFESADKIKSSNLLNKKILASVFYEPSTRTRVSFESAMYKLGGQVISINPSNSSIAKEETVEDTIRMAGTFADVVVLRHPNKDVFVNLKCPVSIINGGNGADEHPTQSLYDLYTIKILKGRLDDLRIAVVGDLANGRTAHSFLTLLSLFNNKIRLVSPNALNLTSEWFNYLKSRKLEFDWVDNLSDGLKWKPDVVYMTRMQRERIGNAFSIDAGWARCCLTDREIGLLPKDAIVMHPLPRNNEIITTFDSDVRAVYFKQAEFGLKIRMALLEELLGE